MTIFDRRTSTVRLSSRQSRLNLKHLTAPKDIHHDFGIDVVEGLNKFPKSIPSKYFYDQLGSELFERICDLDEYYPTRTETAILQSYAAEIAAITGECELIELGSGSSTKTRILLDAYRDRGDRLRYVPIDISGSILSNSAIALLSDYPTLAIDGFVGTYELGLQHLPQPHLPTRLLCFLGSTLGNFSPDECDVFCDRLAGVLQAGEYLLLGIDLQKSKSVLEAAYNDRLGVTAAFNLNLLRHLNYKFEGDFDLTRFEHAAFYNQEQHQIEMYLRSLGRQRVNLRSLDLSIDLEPNETMLTEISRKFNLKHLARDLESKGFRHIRSWTDPNHWYGLVLCQILPLR
ncbi:L-histidine N(alpha)-methyltransferase [Tumidithrix elongata RA019]|uniref:L-histidine N(Alpha)-methyltransferase n=1 Tax=Tumidithrix elongata BACA0141 TaxID=2716417 RepID=A0AAW9Q123_9CYAN|nr:L-histidine N(alpha)-methyltransferase [Tumidithrix elongata RA019]